MSNNNNKMIIENFLTKNNIIWGYLSYTKNGVPFFKIKDHYRPYSATYDPSSFKDPKWKNKYKSKEDYIKRVVLKSQKYPTSCVTYDTSKINCVDVDDKKLNLDEFKKKYSYVNSRNKKLPHFFCKITNNKDLHQSKFRTAIEHLDILTGQASYVKAGEPVFINGDIESKIDLSDLYKLYNKPLQKQNNIDVNKSEIKSTKDMVKPDFDNNVIIEIFRNLDKERYSNYNSWWQIGEYLKWHFGEEGKSYFRQFSLKSNNNEHIKFICSPKFDKLWNSWKCEKVYSLNSFIVWLKQDNIETFNLLPDKIQKNGVKDYESIKTEFEKEHFHVLKSNSFYKKIDGEWISYNKKNFLDVCADYDYTINGKNINFFSKWIRDKNRAKYNNIDWIPTKNYNNDKTFNEFKGFDLDDKYDFYDVEAVETFINHIKYLCSDDEDSIEYFLNYQAHMYQKADERPQAAIVIISPQGTGKDLTVDYHEAILGSDYCMRTSNMKRDLFSSSNGGLKNKILLQLNEVSNLQGFKNIDQIKDIITTKSLIIRQLYQDSRAYTNFLRIFLFSNNSNPLKVTYNSRRFLILKVKEKKSKEYYKKLVSYLNDENALKSIHHYFLKRNIKDFDPSIIPDTQGKSYLVENNKPIIFEFLEQKIQHHKGEKIFFPGSELLQTFKDFMMDNGYKNEYNIKNLKNQLDGIEGIKYGRTSKCRGFKINFDEVDEYIKSKFPQVDFIDD